MKVLLLSGGIDSTAVLIVRREELDAVVFVDYGQPAASQEAKAARTMAFSQMIRFHHVTAPLPCSALSGDGQRVVPHRNLHLLMQAQIATGATSIMIGAMSGDQAAYYDCRPEWLAAASATLGVTVEAPAITWDRASCLSIVSRSRLRRYAWSCYEGGDAPCGVCASCLQDQPDAVSQGLDTE